MKNEVNPQSTSRAHAFDLWMSSPMPMVTLTKTLHIGHALRVSRRSGIKFNALMCWAVGKAAQQVEEFFTLPEDGKLFRYDCLAVNVVVANRNGGINSCDIAIGDSLSEFWSDYERLTTLTAAECKSTFLPTHMIVGTSAMVQTELDSITNIYTPSWPNPIVLWGRWRRGWLKSTLPVSFQFHHVQMDGAHGALFLQLLQKTLDSL